MPLIQQGTDSLPYIDATPSAEGIAAAHALIQADVDGDASTIQHPLIPSTIKSNFSALAQSELERLQSGIDKITGIDLSRYDVLDAPDKGELEAWRTTIQKAYASSEYLRDRELNLALLETYGKNAWLISNSQLEDILRSLEHDLESAKTKLENVEQARRERQAEAAGELKSLEETWRQGIGRTIEAQVAGERLRSEILDRRRHGVT